FAQLGSSVWRSVFNLSQMATALCGAWWTWTAVSGGGAWTGAPAQIAGLLAAGVVWSVVSTAQVAMAMKMRSGGSWAEHFRSWFRSEWMLRLTLTAIAP